MPVLDTSFLIDVEQKLPAAVAAIGRLKPGQAIVPFQAALEFATGFTDPQKALHAIAAAFEVRYPNAEQVVAGATLRKSAAKSRPAWADLQIAIPAYLDDDIVVTANPGDFAALGVKTWNYRSEAAPSA